MPFFKYTTDFPFVHECPESEAQFCDISQLNAERQKPSTNTGMNAIALLEECVINGDKGEERLYAWFCAEYKLIKATVLCGQQHHA